MKVAIGQMTSADAYAPNIEMMQSYAAEAAAKGAILLCLPEVAGLMNRDRVRAAELVGPFERDPYFQAVRKAAATHEVWIHAGSSPVAGPDGKFLNRSALITPKGETLAVYDKIHLFDVAIDGQKPIGESKRFAAGAEAVVAKTPIGQVGMTICYDLRFPALYRETGAAWGGNFLCPISIYGAHRPGALGGTVAGAGD